MRNELWGPRVEGVTAWRNDIDDAEYAIRVAERELNGSLVVAVTRGAELRRDELNKRIAKRRREIAKLEKRIADAESVA